MTELEKAFEMSDIDEPIDAQFEPHINYSRVASYEGYMCFTPTKVYLLPRSEAAAMTFHPKCFPYEEVVSYGRKLLAGYEITLKDGRVISDEYNGKILDAAEALAALPVEKE